MTKKEDILLRRQRHQIDRIDTAMLDLLALRFEVVQQVAKIKKAHDIEAYLPVRSQQVIDKCVAQAQKKNIDADLVRAIWTEIINAAVAQEKKY